MTGLCKGGNEPPVSLKLVGIHIIIILIHEFKQTRTRLQKQDYETLMGLLVFNCI